MSRPSRPQANRKGPQLPVSLQQKLGIPSKRKRQRTQVAERKQKRQDARNHQKFGNKRRKLVHEEDDEDEDSAVEIGLSDREDDDDLTEEKEEPVLYEPGERVTKIKNVQRDNSPDSPPLSPQDNYEDGSDDLSRGSREYSPEVVLDANSRTFQDRQAEEDAEIAALERRLGLRGKSSRKTLDDGFEGLFGSLEDSTDIKKTKEDEKIWLEKKRQSSSTAVQSKDKQRTIPDHIGTESESNDEDKNSKEETSSGDEAEDHFEGFDEEEKEDEDIEDQGLSKTTQRQMTATRENPYVAPAANSSSTGKYVPPAQRKLLQSDSALLTTIRRKAQGSLNKLSEANIISIIDEVEKLYQDNPRQDVTDVVIDLLIGTFANPSVLQNTFIILHAAFVAALYKVLGADFGAEMVSRLVETFDSFHNDANIRGKECLNLTSLLANLFTFGMMSSALIFDHIKILLSKFDEDSAELLLRMIRDCGPQLRVDAPTALKDIVQMMNQMWAQITSSGQSLTVRTRVMMDTITDLKNNKTRQATNAAGVTGEHLTRMRKTLGSLNNRQLRATDPLGITRSDILNGSKKGKWWLVGASWRGHGPPQESDRATRKHPTETEITALQPYADGADEEIDTATLTSHLRLPTPTARSICIAITTATDPTDALARLSKIRLTKRQEAEIARILIRVCRAEASYNPYYAAVARLLLREKRYKMSFHIALWKFFRQLGESPDNEDEGGSDDEQSDWDNVGSAEIANVALMYSSLIVRRVLDVNILKTLSIGFTKENATLFLELFFTSLFTNSKVSDKQLVEMFSVVELRLVKSLAYFIDRYVRKTDLVSDKHERQRVKAGCRTAQAALSALLRESQVDLIEE